MSSTDGDTVAAPRAWRAYCERLAALGDTILGAEFPADPRARAEGYRHLARLSVFALQSELEFSDRAFPMFHRYDDDVVKWGGPNADNQYQRARIDPAGTYRLTGDVTGVRALIVSTHEGDMQLGQYRVFEERTLSELGVGDDGRLSVTLAAAPHPEPWIPLAPEVDHVLVRQYVSDWERDAVAPLDLERLDPPASAPEPATDAAVAVALERAVTWVEASARFWNDYLRRSRTNGTDNVLSPPRHPPGGAQNIHYGGGWWHLADDEALLVECEPPDAPYWGFQLYADGWFESLDFAHRVTSLNGHQTHVDDDGRFRIAISARDPGIQNWLDTEGRAAGLVTYRWVDSTTEPAPTATVVPVAEVRSRLADTTPPFTPEQRRHQIAIRRAATVRRFRT